MRWGDRAVSENFRMMARSGSGERKMLWGRRGLALWATALFCLGSVFAQTTESAQQPKTAPATASVLYSYEGQNVTSVEVAGRPDLDTSKILPILQQHAGEPFAREKVDQSIETLKREGKFEEVQLQVDPEANGVRILLIAEPAVWFGIFEFPGAE